MLLGRLKGAHVLLTACGLGRASIRDSSMQQDTMGQGPLHLVTLMAASPRHAQRAFCCLMQVNGQVVIENFEGFSMFNMMVMNTIPQKLLKLCFKMQGECMPFRLR